jgi:hypothetical protein
MKSVFKSALILMFILIITGFVCAEPSNGVMKAILIIENQYDSPQLNNITESTNMDQGFVNKFLDILTNQNVIRVEKTLLQGPNATRKNITTLLKNLQITSRDVLFIYFSGHGGMDKKNTFLLTADGGFLYRNELESLVKTKPARLSLVFSDACSSSIEAIGGRGTFLKDNKEKESAFVEIYKNLFYNYQGLLYVTAATEGEYAWGGKDGGAFTKSLFHEVLMQDPRLSWEENFNEAKKRTQDKFNYLINMGILKPEDLKDLDKRGIKSQTPKVYSLPTSNSIVSIDTQTIETQQNTESQLNKSIRAYVKNLTDKTITFYIDNNVFSDDRWSWDNCTKKIIKPNASITLEDSKPLIVFFDNGKKKSLSYKLDTGSYVFEAEKGGTINMFTETNANSNDASAEDSKENNDKTDNDHDVGVGSIMCK